MCDKCFSISAMKYYSKCKCADKKCNGSMIEIDELFLISISILNKKGYRTTFCCSGHPLEHKTIYNHSYISFDSNILLPNLPVGFKYDEDIDCNINGDIVIRKFFSDLNNDSKITKELLITAKDVLEWAESLPDEKHIL